MERVGIVGAGAMGAGIAEVAARAGASVLLYDVAPAALARGVEALRASLARAVERGKIPPQLAADAAARVATVDSLDAFTDVTLVIEAVAEQLEVKREVFRRLDALCPPETLLATNTSSLSVTEIAAATAQPQRVVGLHFFNPAQVLPLVEVVGGAASAPAAVDRARRAAEWLGKRPVLVRDSPGFVVNRVARPFYLEALRVVGDGYAGIGEVDAALRGVGFRMGPFELIDLVGSDVNLAVSQSIYEQWFQEPRFRPHPLQQALVRAGRLGRKSGSGFYEYTTQPPRPTLVERPAIAPPSGPWSAWAPERRVGFIVGRTLASLVNEAYWAVGQGVATREDVDLAMRLGTNWPLGPFEWGEERGLGLVLETLAALERAHGPAYLPAPLLRAVAHNAARQPEP